MVRRNTDTNVGVKICLELRSGTSHVRGARLWARGTVYGIDACSARPFVGLRKASQYGYRMQVLKAGTILGTNLNRGSDVAIRRLVASDVKHNTITRLVIIAFMDGADDESVGLDRFQAEARNNVIVVVLYRHEKRVRWLIDNATSTFIGGHLINIF